MNNSNPIFKRALNSTWVILALLAVLCTISRYWKPLSKSIILCHLDKAQYLAIVIWLYWLVMLLAFMFIKPTSAFFRLATGGIYESGQTTRKSSAWIQDLIYCGIFCVLYAFSLFWHKWIPSFAYEEPLYLLNRLIRLLLSFGFVFFLFRLTFTGLCQKIGGNLPFRIVTSIISVIYSHNYLSISDLLRYDFYMLYAPRHLCLLHSIPVMLLLPLNVYVFLVIIRCFLKLCSKSFSAMTSWENVFLFIFV